MQALPEGLALALHRQHRHNDDMQEHLVSENFPEREDRSLRASETRGLDSFPAEEPQRYDPVLHVGADGDDGTADIDD